MLDRFDLAVPVKRPTAEALARGATTSSAAVREAVLGARERQDRRLAGTGARCNADMDPSLVRALIAIDDRGRAVLADAYDRDFISARGHDRIVRVAQTMADLAGRDRVGAADVLAAIKFRQGEAIGQEAAA